MTNDARPNEDYTLGDHVARESDEYAKAKFRLTLRWLRGEARGARLANIGCGSGVFNRMAVDAGFQVAAFEPDPPAYELAARALPSSNCTLSPLPLESIDGTAIADVVVMHDVLEHLPDDRAAVERLHRLADPRGRVILSVPAMPSLFGYHDEQLGHHRRYTRRTLRAVLEPSFRIVRLRAFGFAFIPITLWFSKWRRRPYPVESSGRRGLLGRAVRAVCTLESRVPAPIGTSLVCELRPR